MPWMVPRVLLVVCERYDVCRNSTDHSCSVTCGCRELAAEVSNFQSDPASTTLSAPVSPAASDSPTWGQLLDAMKALAAGMEARRPYVESLVKSLDSRGKGKLDLVQIRTVSVGALKHEARPALSVSHTCGNGCVGRGGQCAGTHGEVWSYLQDAQWEWCDWAECSGQVGSQACVQHAFEVRHHAAATGGAEHGFECPCFRT
jgi:hypothetical protein